MHFLLLLFPLKEKSLTVVLSGHFFFFFYYVEFVLEIIRKENKEEEEEGEQRHHVLCGDKVIDPFLSQHGSLVGSFRVKMIQIIIRFEKTLHARLPPRLCVLCYHYVKPLLFFSFFS